MNELPNPENYPIGWVESRAAARAIAASRQDPNAAQPHFRIIIDMPRPRGQPLPPPQRWRDRDGNLHELIFVEPRV